MNDDQRLYAAAASGHDNFCIGITNQDLEDPYSIVLSYNGGLAQPWGRVDWPGSSTTFRSMTGSTLH